MKTKAIIFDIIGVILQRGEDGKLKPDKKIIQLINSLDSEGYLVGYLTNGSGETVDFLIDEEVLPDMPIRLASTRMGVNKPNRKAYENLKEELDKEGVKPGEAIFIDDSERNLAPLQDIKGIYFKNNKDLLKELEDYGITVNKNSIKFD
jgi:FMN phosphatase YigB (HAD superfamily)